LLLAVYQVAGKYAMDRHKTACRTTKLCKQSKKEYLNENIGKTYEKLMKYSR